MSRRALRVPLGFLTVLTVIVAVTGCGGSGGLPADAVARVGNTDISKVTLNHWMSALVGGDFYEISGIVAPKGLVSEPANYPSCVVALRALTLNPPAPQRKPTTAWLELKCRQLAQAVKLQAVEYLIRSQVVSERAREAGLTVTEAEVQRAFARQKAEQFPTETKLKLYLAQRGWSLSDELFLLTKDLHAARLDAALQQRFSNRGGEQALISFSHSSTAKWRSKTICRAGYVAEGCKEFNSSAPPSSAPSANVLIEEIERLHPKPKRKLAPDILCNNKKNGKGLTCRPFK